MFLYIQAKHNYMSLTFHVMSSKTPVQSLNKSSHLVQVIISLLNSEWLPGALHPELSPDIQLIQLLRRIVIPDLSACSWI